MIKLSLFQEKNLKKHPFLWAVFDNAFCSVAEAEALQREFPICSFSKIVSSRLDKAYSARVASIDDAFYQDMPYIWQQLISQLRGAEYSSAVERLTGLSLQNLKCELSLWRYVDGDYLSPHLDKPEKIVTQVFYFSSVDWNQTDGGCLEILTDHRPSSVVRKIEPRLGRIVTLVRSNNSWHAVSRCQRCDKVRLSLQVVFANNGLRYSNES